MRESVHHLHDVIMYVPCFYSYPGFTYSMADATSDEQMAWSMKPDYVLVLRGRFDAKTQPFSDEVHAYNRRPKCEICGLVNEPHECKVL